MILYRPAVIYSGIENAACAVCQKNSVSEHGMLQATERIRKISLSLPGRASINLIQASGIVARTAGKLAG